MIFKTTQRIEIVTIPETPYICLANDLNFTPKAIALKDIAIEKEIEALEVVQNIQYGDNIIDCGALYGDTAIQFARQGAKVYAIEAQADAAFCLKWNADAHGHIVAMHAAAGNGQPVETNSDPLNGNLGTRTISIGTGNPSYTLDSFMFLDSLAGIKIDIEGSELFALEGAREIIHTFKPWLLIEVYPEMMAKHGTTKEALYAELESMHYTWTPVIGNETEPRWDILATPK